MHVTFLGRTYVEVLLLGSDSASLVIVYFHVKLFILIGWEAFDENHDHPQIMKLHHNTLWNLTTGDSVWWRVMFQKYLDYSGFMCGRFTVDSDWRHPNVWIYRVRKCKHWISLNLNCFDIMSLLVSTLYHEYIIVPSRLSLLHMMMSMIAWLHWLCIPEIRWTFTEWCPIEWW